MVQCETADAESLRVQSKKKDNGADFTAGENHSQGSAVIPRSSMKSEGHRGGFERIR